MKIDMIFDVIILGAGGAGMMCALEAGHRGRNVLLLDHASKVGGKILISGGGRCNFTNLGASPRNYVSENPHFMKSAMSRFTPVDFVHMVEKHGIPYHEKKLGQQFCDDSARDIVNMLKKECDEAGAQFRLGQSIEKVYKLKEEPALFCVEVCPKENLTSRTSEEAQSENEKLYAHSLVIATGGFSLPKLGATGIGYRLARQFGLEVTETDPALDGFSLEGSEVDSFRQLSGLSIEVVMTSGVGDRRTSFRENVLFTHSGLSGPVSLQCSLYWKKGEKVSIDFCPDEKDLFEWFKEKKNAGVRSQIKSLLSEKLPSRFVEHFCEIYFKDSSPLPQVSETKLREMCALLKQFDFIPTSTIGYSKAEVTRGGVNTNELSSKTMESKKIPGLYFIGEVVDVTGWLGGYNFQWAWASGWAAGQVV